MANVQTTHPVSRAQGAQTKVVKSVTILPKMLDKALNLKAKLPDMTKSSGHGIDATQKDLDIFINDGMDSIETMLFVNCEINARRRGCMEPDLNEDYIHVTLFFTSSHKPSSLWW